MYYSQVKTLIRARSYITQALNNNGKVLIVCNGGISRGPAITIMYVMEAAHLSFEDALNYVQNKVSLIISYKCTQLSEIYLKRYCISPNMGFQSQIKVSYDYQFQ